MEKSHQDPLLPDGDAALDWPGSHSRAVKVAACPVSNFPAEMKISLQWLHFNCLHFLLKPYNK